ncbi:Glutamine synthetase [Kyrpidia spormannii]|uniref:Glutamine synthetase n=2 Tax=Kyrpidia spormannii TaxID=2055160 RepID=A0A6F9EHX1_9BACL|nr:Glutamine synthetase [Kyrpidia spormannii]
MTMLQSPDELISSGVNYALISFVELNGFSRAKLVPMSVLSSVKEHGAGFAGFAAGDIGQGPHDPDLVAIPDLGSMQRVPWREDVCWFASDLYVEGRSWPYCPRTTAKRVLRMAQEKGYRFMVGMEPEFFLLRKGGDGRLEPADPLDMEAKPCYNQQSIFRNLDFITRLVDAMNRLGWGVYQCDHEDANGQFEINWAYTEALEQADRLTFARFLIRSLAEEQGLIATFMPKPFSRLTGNGAHCHVSLWDEKTGRNLFLPEGGAEGNPLALSDIGRWFIGGLLAHARALAAFTTPTVNSYKRLWASTTDSGATWAPVYVTYGGNNRTVMLRIPGEGRVEYRAVDGAVNPYLALAAIVAAGLDGIERQIDPGPPFAGNAYKLTWADASERGMTVLPRTLKEALEALDGDEVLTEALGPDLVSLYLEVKEREWREYHASVSEWEVERYLHLG